MTLSAQVLLEHVQEAMVVVDLRGSIAGGRSAAFDRLFGAPSPGVSLARHVGLEDGDVRAFRGELRRAARIYELRVRRLEPKEAGLALVVFADVTEARERISFDRAAFQELVSAVSTGAPRSDLAERIRALSYDSATDLLARLAEEARHTAAAFDRPAPKIEIEGGHVRLDGAFWTPFFAALSHLVREVVLDASSPAAARIASGKAPGLRLTFRAAVEDGRFVLEIRDDGRGEPGRSGLPASQVALETNVRSGSFETRYSPGRGTSRLFRFPPVGCAAIAPPSPVAATTLRPGSGLRAAVRRDR